MPVPVGLANLPPSCCRGYVAGPLLFSAWGNCAPTNTPQPRERVHSLHTGCLTDARPLARPPGGGVLMSHPPTLHTAAAPRKTKLVKPRGGFSQGATILHGTSPFFAFFFLGEYLLTEGPKVNQTNQTSSSHYSSPDPTPRSSCHEQFGVHHFRSQTLSAIQINTQGSSF